MPFLSQAHYEEVDDGGTGRPTVRLTHFLVYALTTNGGELKVKVPAGFVTDLATTPRILWPIFPPWGRWNRAAILHDYLCVHRTCSRFLADALFREAMKDLGVPLWRRVIMYYAVRIWAIATLKG